VLVSVEAVLLVVVIVFGGGGEEEAVFVEVAAVVIKNVMTLLTVPIVTVNVYCNMRIARLIN
jgi:hypothetical protein